MLRVKRTLIALAIAGAAGICACSTASAATGNGTLTSAEYRQLSAATDALNKSASSKTISWSKARAACQKTGGATALLRTQRASCLKTITVYQALAAFPVQEHNCSASVNATTGTTTTGTTTATTTTGTTTPTTPAESAALRVLVCMSPRYRALGVTANAAYKANSSARKEALARGFSGVCLATLVSTPGQLRTDAHFASSSQKLAADVTVLIRVTQGKAPASSLDQSRIDADAKQFSSSSSAVLAENGPQKLSACAHD